MLWNPVAFDERAYEGIQRAFKDYEIQVIAYLRPVADHILSGYAHRVCGPQRYPKKFSDHVQDMVNVGTYEYRSRIASLKKVFGANNVNIAWLPNLKNDVLSPMRQLLPELESVEQVPNMNQSKGWIYVASTRQINRTQKITGRRIANKLQTAALRVDGLASSKTLQKQFTPANRGTIKDISEEFKDQDLYAMSVENCR